VSAPENLEGLKWPDGEPGPLRGAAGRLHGLAGSFDGAAGRLPAAIPASWSGMASSSYSGTLARAGTAVSYVADSLGHAATAYGRLADVIEEAQDTVRHAAAKLHAAREAAKRARAHADAARAEASRARADATFSPVLATVGGTDPLAVGADAAEGRALTAESAAADADAEAARVERWAHGEADRANSDVERADAACAGALDGTGLTGGLPVNGAAVASGAQAVWDFVYDVAGKPLNPWDPGYTPGESNAVWGGYASGLLFGTSEWTSRYASENWMRTVPGYWERAPRWVAPYTRSTPSGGTTQVSGYMRNGVWHGAEEVADDAARAKWAARASTFGKAGTVAAFVTAGVGQYFADANNPNLNGTERTGRIVAQSATVGTASAVGGWGGAMGGAAIGTMICPGVGTVVGGVVGGIIGGGVLGGLADHFNDGLVDWAGGAADDVADFAGDVKDKAGDLIDDITPDVDLTPW
jgi:uncharacterized protein YjbJ (UPF0337 family)